MISRKRGPFSDATIRHEAAIYGSHGAREEASGWRDQPEQRLTAIITYNDAMAAGVLPAAHACDISMPEDHSLTGQ